MPNYLRGEDINIGFGVEDPSDRGTWVTPQIWVFGRTPAGIISEPEFVEIRETKTSGMDAQDSETIKTKAVGDFEFNVKVESFGFFLKSFLGQVTTSGLGGGAYQHTFEVLETNPQHPSLSCSLSLPRLEDYKYPLTVIKTLAIRTPIDDVVNATVGLLASSEVKAGTDFFTVTETARDYRFRHQDVVIKIADTEAELDAATGIELKSFEMTGDNNSRGNQTIGSLSGYEIVTLLQNLNINFSSDYLDETYRDLITDNTEKAMRLEMIRSDILIDTENPTIQFNFPKVKLSTRTQDRPIEDIVIDNCTARVYDAPNVVIINEREDYNNA